MSDRWCPRSKVKQQDHPVLHGLSSESDSMPQLVGSAPPSAVQMGQTEEVVGPSLRIPTSQPRGRSLKQCPFKKGAGNSLPSLPERDGADSDGYSTERFLDPIATIGGGVVRSGWHPCIWTC